MKNSSYLCTQQAHPASRDQRAQGEPFFKSFIMNKVIYSKQIQSFANQIGIIFQSVATILDNA